MMSEYEPYKYDTYEEYVSYSLEDFLRGYSVNFSNDVFTLLKTNNFRTIRENYLEWDLDPASKLYDIYQSPIFKVLEQVICLNFLDTYVVTYPKTLFNNYDHPLQPNLGKEFNNVFGTFMRNFESVLLSTYDKYDALIRAYYGNSKSMKDFLSPIKNKTISKSRANELPTASLEDPYDSKYANSSNLAEVTSEIDGNTLMARLEEIRRNCYNIYEEWSNEFALLFEL